MTCLNDGKQFGKEATHALYVNVIGTHNEAEYQKFRSQIDSLLQELEQYATTENLRNETIYLTLQRFALGLRLNYLCRKC